MYRKDMVGMIHNKKLLIFVAVTAGILLFWRGWRRAQQPRTAPAGAALVVGTNVGYPPFILRDENGHVVGFDRDIAYAIAQRLGRTLVVKDMSFDALLLSLPQGSVDMIIGGISITSARKAKGWLLPYFGDTVDRVALFYRTDRVSGDITLAQAAAQKMTVCTQAGSSFEEVLATFPGLQVKTLPDISDIFLEVDHGSSDIGVLDPHTVSVLTRGRAQLGSHEQVLPPELHIDGFGIGIAPFNKELRAQVAGVIEDLRRDGTIAKLTQKWFA